MSTSNPKRTVISMAMLRSKNSPRPPESGTSAKCEPDGVGVFPAHTVALSVPVAPSPNKVKEAKGWASSSSTAHAQSAVSREMRRVLEVDLSRPGLLRLTDVLRLYRVSRSTWYAGIKSGLYKPGIPIGPRCVAWRSEYILSLLENPPTFVRA